MAPELHPSAFHSILPLAHSTLFNLDKQDYGAILSKSAAMPIAPIITFKAGQCGVVSLTAFEVPCVWGRPLLTTLCCDRCHRRRTRSRHRQSPASYTCTPKMVSHSLDQLGTLLACANFRQTWCISAGGSETTRSTTPSSTWLWFPPTAASSHTSTTRPHNRLRRRTVVYLS